MDDFQRFHRKALLWMLGAALLALLACWAAASAGQPWAVPLLLIVWGAGTRAVYHRQLRRFQRGQCEERHGKWKKHESGDDE